MENIKSLKCRECKSEYSPKRISACEKCFSPLEIVYNLNAIEIDHKIIEKRPPNIWRYHELLPIKDLTIAVDIGAGFTRMRECKNLAKKIGVKRLYVKDDTANPTGSFKDRPASVAVTKALEFGFTAVGCASTGNLAAATAAHASKAGLPCYVFVPRDIERNKLLQAGIYGANIVVVRGTYDEANRLAAQAADEFNWALVNINLRPYYVEGSKTLAFETCEQLGWKTPDNIIVPTGSGALLCSTWRGLKQFEKLGLVNDAETKIVCAQPQGCAPIVDAFKKGLEDVTPIEKPRTIAKSLAIGDPGDGKYALKVIRESGGTAEQATDEEITEGIKLLAKAEGIFTEPAGGVVIAVLKKLVESGQIGRDEEVVCYITGSGFKAVESLEGKEYSYFEIAPSISELKNVLSREVSESGEDHC
ncbi:MAG: threonine synthase [Candidatus Bathyarchaeia archaeon]